MLAMQWMFARLLAFHQAKAPGDFQEWLSHVVSVDGCHFSMVQAFITHDRKFVWLIQALF